MNAEAIKFIELFRRLDFERTKEFCYMVKGALFIARNSRGQKGDGHKNERF